MYKEYENILYKMSIDLDKTTEKYFNERQTTN